MEHLYEIEHLAASARALRAEPQAQGPRAEAEAGLLFFGLEVERVPELGPEWQAQLGLPERQALLGLAQELRAADLATLRRGLEAADVPGRLAVHPGLSDEPDACEQAQAGVLAALEARERLHRLELAVQALGGTCPPEVAGLDERLRSVVSEAAALQPARARYGAELEPPLLPAHWWWSLPAAEAPDDAPEEGLVAGLGQWVRERLADGPDGRRLVLGREEARALLSTPQGAWLADELADRLDLSAGACSPEEREEVLGKRTLGEVMGTGGARGKQPLLGVIQGGRATSRASGQAHAREPVRGTRPGPRCAAAAGGVTSKLGLEAVVGFEVESAALEPEVGLVACGVNRETGASAWLLLPALEVEAVALDAPSSREHPRTDWRRGGLLWTTDESSLRLRLQVRSGGALESRRLEYHRASDAGQDDALIEVLDLIALGDRQAACEAFEGLCREVPRPVLAGLEAALQPESWKA